MGFNLRIIHKNTDMNTFWSDGFSDLYISEKLVANFLKFKHFSFAHVTASLHEKMIWNDKAIVLTGISPEFEPSGKKKSPMIFTIEAGYVYIGFEIAQEFNIEQGDEIEINGKDFKVINILAESGSVDDIRIYGNLHDIQTIVGKIGKINEIKALNCLCISENGKNPLNLLRNQLKQIVPDAKVIMNTTIATAREQQRHMFENYFKFILPAVVIVIIIWLGTLTMLNVRERGEEIGVLRALGYSSVKVAGLFLCKAILMGVIGAVIGFILGTVISLELGVEIFKLTGQNIHPIYDLLTWALVITPLITIIASIIPVTVAILHDPAMMILKN